MDERIGRIFKNLSDSQLSIEELLLNLAIGAALAVLLAWHYVRFGSSFSNRRRFARILAPLALTTVLVFTVIKSSWTLSLGLVGALSIVRFRTPIKEPEELVYLFLAIAIGLGLGASQQWVTVLGIGLILGGLAVRAKFRRRPALPNLFLNVELPNSNGSSEKALRELIELLGRHAAAVDMRRCDLDGKSLATTFHVECRDMDQLVGAQSEIRQKFPDSTVSFVEQSDMPGA